MKYDYKKNIDNKGIINRLITLDYHKELIDTLLKNKSGALATGVVAPIMFSSFMYGYIPSLILICWLMIHFLLFSLRTKSSAKLLSLLDKSNKKTIKKHLVFILLLIFINALLWNFSTVLTLIYADEIHVIFLVGALFALLAGSIATLSAVYHAVFIYAVSIILISAFIFFFIGASNNYSFIGLSFVLYFLVIIPTSFRVYTIINNSILQKEEIMKLNNALKLKISKAISDTEKKEKLLQQQTRLAQMGEMISMIAHQWRQPLGAISSAIMSIEIKLVMGKFDLTEEYDREKFLKFINKKHKNINNYVQVLTTTIDDFRTFFKPDRAKQLIMLNIPVIQALKIVQTPMVNKGIEIKTNFQVNDKIPLYQNEIMQVILNILKNSEDNFLEKKWLAAQNSDDSDLNKLTPFIFIETIKEKNIILIRIIDNGGGIPDTILSNIFDPYFSTKTEKDGTGLGLYMSKVMIEEHNGGKLSVANNADGVCFEVSFPISS